MVQIFPQPTKNVVADAKRLMNSINPVFLSRPDIRAFGENHPDNARIFVILPGFFLFNARSERY